MNQQPNRQAEDRLHALHLENQRAIDDLRVRLDHLLAQSEAQLVALRTIIGGPIGDMEALLRFRDEHQRFRIYDRRITTAAEGLAVWAIRGLLVGMAALTMWGMGSIGAFSALKEWIK